MGTPLRGMPCSLLAQDLIRELTNLQAIGTVVLTSFSLPTGRSLRQRTLPLQWPLWHLHVTSVVPGITIRRNPPASLPTLPTPEAASHTLRKMR